jgi:hypothetical protein
MCTENIPFQLIFRIIYKNMQKKKVKGNGFGISGLNGIYTTMNIRHY